LCTGGGLGFGLVSLPVVGSLVMRSGYDKAWIVSIGLAMISAAFALFVPDPRSVERRKGHLSVA
jgi:hypothetical protein